MPHEAKPSSFAKAAEAKSGFVDHYAAEPRCKHNTNHTRGARKLHKWSASETSSQATEGSDFTSKASENRVKM